MRADFGLAKLAGAAAGAELGVAGTPAYMPPEQSRDPAGADHRADIYALGVVFYQLLTGEVPPADRSKWLPPSAKVQVDVRLDEIVLKALERMPERRYATATELRTALETMASAGGRKVPVLTPYRAPTANFSPATPRGSRILVYRLASTFEPGDLVVFQQGAVAMLARVTRRGPVDGLLHVERKDGSDQLLMVGEVVGKVVLNTRERDGGAVRE